MTEFATTCTHCSRAITFTIDEVPTLRRWHDDQMADAYNRGEEEGERAADGLIDLEEAIDEHVLEDLAAAIAKGGNPEAMRLLELLASELGSAAEHRVQLGRFRREPGHGDLFEGARP